MEYDLTQWKRKTYMKREEYFSVTQVYIIIQEKDFCFPATMYMDQV